MRRHKRRERDKDGTHVQNVHCVCSFFFFLAYQRVLTNAAAVFCGCRRVLFVVKEKKKTSTGTGTGKVLIWIQCVRLSLVSILLWFAYIASM